MKRKIPSRIRRMSLRRQKVAMVRWLQRKIAESMKQFIDTPTHESKEAAAQSIFDTLQQLAPPDVVVSNPRIDGDLLTVDISGPASIMSVFVQPEYDPDTDKEPANVQP